MIIPGFKLTLDVITFRANALHVYSVDVIASDIRSAINIVLEENDISKFYYSDCCMLTLLHTKQLLMFRLTQKKTNHNICNSLPLTI